MGQMKDIERIADALERIAAALEKKNTTVIYQTANGAGGGGSYSPASLKEHMRRDQ